MVTKQQNNEQGGNKDVPNAARGLNVSTGDASVLESLNNNLQNVLWLHGISILTNKEKVALITRLMNTAPPQINVTTSQVLANMSTIKRDDTLGELPGFENSDGGQGPLCTLGLSQRNPNMTPINPNVTQHAPGSYNPYLFSGTPWAGHNYNIGTPVGLRVKNLNFPPGPTVPTYAGYHEPPSMIYSAEAIKLAVPKLKKDDKDSYLVFMQKFHTDLIFNNLGHVTDEKLMKSLLPLSREHIYPVACDHPWALAVKENNQVMAF